ncbi:MAG: substrate-binding domain-containing protein [Proteobacteria bacterium]|nr:substrate-binding domain-containing protein [Pseudomonadota bacterium]
MKKWVLLLIALLLMTMASTATAGDCTAVYGNGAAVVRLATGSPGELGLLERLAAAFAPEHKASICWKKAGSGASLNLLKEKKVDLIMVHAPAAEKKAVSDGWAVNRKLLGSNEFYIVGPKNDPAGAAEAKTAAEAYARIAKVKAKFISRGDNSGTHKKELAVWKQAGIKPAGDWYIVTKDFMMASLKKANQIGAYFMTDSSTWVQGKKELGDLKILFKGDPFLINTYHALCQPAGATEAAALASSFIDFLVSQAGQKIFADYGRAEYGEALYNDAAYAAQYDH